MIEPVAAKPDLVENGSTRKAAPDFRRSRWRTGAFGIRYPRLGRHLSDTQLGFLMVAPALALMLFYVLYPLWTVLSNSFQDFPSPIGAGTWVGLDNFRWLIDGQQFLPALGRSVYYTVTNVVLQTILGFLIALLLNQSLPGRNIARGAILFPFIVPGVVAAIIWGYLFDGLTGIVDYLLISAHIIKEPLGWLASPSTAMNTVVAISVWKFLPFMIILFLARLQTIPVDALEAAKVDGANAMQIFRYLILPWMLPVVLIAVMLRTIFSFNEFEMPFLLTQGGPLNTTLVLPVMIRKLLVDDLSPGRASAVSALMIGILVIFGIIYMILYRRTEKSLEE